MDLRTHRNALLLMRQLFDRKKSTVPVIETRPQKPACPCRIPAVRYFPRMSPESQGVPSDHLAGFVEMLKNDETLDLHGIMILRNGAVIAEGAFGAYDQNLWHITHSECKSITALAVGMLIDDGKLSVNDKIVKFFEKLPMMAALTHKELTVRHLLTMSSGVVFNEVGAVTETDWVRCFFESAVRGEPGRQFEYNSMNTYMLSAIVRQVSGQGLMAFLKDRLWEPLGIRDIFWETCPEGIEKGGWGLYIRPEDIAKIGQLVLQKGVWNGRRLVSEKWISEATACQIHTPEYLGNYNYGYQIWVGRKQNCFLFSGMFSQNVLGFPDTGLLIVSNAGNNELFQKSQFFDAIEKYFGADDPPAGILPTGKLPVGRMLENPKAARRLQNLMISLGDCPPAGPSRQRPLFLKDRTVTRLRDLLEELDGKTYLADKPDAASVGLLPILTQAIQNNYTRGLKSLGFQLDGDVFYLTVEETDETYRLPVGFGAPGRIGLVFHGEPHEVGVTGEFTADEDGRLVLKIRVSFLEIANARLLKIYFVKDAIRTKWTESPSKQYVTGGMAILGKMIKLGGLYQTILSKADPDFIAYKFDGLFEPEVTCRLASV